MASPVTMMPLLGLVIVATITQALANPRVDAVVTASGTGDYKTVQEAINKVPQTTTADKPWIILVKPGTYKELVHAQREKRSVHLVGEDPQKTIITYGLFAGMTGPDGLNIGTFRTPTVMIDADDFIFGGATALFNHCTLHCLRDGYAR